MANTASQRFLLRFARKAGDGVILLGILTFVGWLLDVLMSDWTIPGFLATDPVTALLFVISGLALRYQAQVEPRGRAGRRDRMVTSCAGIVVLISALRLVEYFLGFDFSSGIWHWVVGNHSNEFFLVRDMSPATALNFLICGGSLLVFDDERRNGFRPAQAGLLAVAFMALLSLLGCAYGVLPLYHLGPALPMSLNSAIAFELFALAALAARPDRGVLAEATSDTIGGATARRLLPSAILIPLVLGALCFSGVKHGYYELGFGISLFAVATMIVFTVLIWWKTKLLVRVEQARVQTERRLSVQYQATRVLAESSAGSEAIRKFLEILCQGLDRQEGAIWRVYADENVIRCEAAQAQTAAAEAFAESSRGMSLKCGVGLPGRVWQTLEPAWIREIQNDSNFPRASCAATAGLRSALAFPIWANGKLCGVAELFGDRPDEPDETLLETLTALGSQLGQFLERKHAEEQLKRASSELAHSNTELQQFAYIASHDLSEPLRMVVSYLQLLVERSRNRLDAESKEFIGYAVDGARRMQALIQDLLAYARVDTQRKSFGRVDCEQVLSGVLSNLRVSINESGAVIEQEPLPVVHGDPVQLAQVFQNLITNAIKFHGKDPPRVRVGATRDDEKWTFHIADNGIGIDTRDFERIFVLFQRLHTRQDYPGTGMGLAICKKIVERHGGQIWLESKPGKGTTFYFTLPASPQRFEKQPPADQVDSTV